MTSVIPDDYQRRGTLWSLASTMANALFLFIVFRATIDILGAPWMGAWALIQGLLLVSRVADSGAGVNITRSVAARLKSGQNVSARSHILSGMLIGTLPVTVLGSAIVLPVALFVAGQYPDLGSTSFITLLTVAALLNAVISSMATLTLAVAEGLFRLVPRSKLNVAANSFAAVASYPALIIFGPLGIPIVYLLLSIIQLSGGVLISRGDPLQEDSVARVVRSLWRENLQLSGTALLRLLFEPLTKLALAFVASLSAIAAFELALRVSTQLRVLVQSGIQPLLTIGARTRGSSPNGQHREVFSRTNQVVWMVASWLVVIQSGAASLISWMGLAQIDETFLVFFGILCISNFFNTLGLVGYFAQLSSGHTLPLLWLHLLMAAVNGLGAIAGVLLDSQYLVVVSYALAFTVGGVGSWYFIRHTPLPSRVRLFAGLSLVPAVLLLALQVLTPLLDPQLLLVSISVATSVSLLAAVHLRRIMTRESRA